MAIAGTGLFLSANVGCLISASLASNVLLTSLRSGLDKELRGFADRESVRFHCHSPCAWLNEDENL